MALHRKYQKSKWGFKRFAAIGFIVFMISFYAGYIMASSQCGR